MSYEPEGARERGSGGASVQVDEWTSKDRQWGIGARKALG